MKLNITEYQKLIIKDALFSERSILEKILEEKELNQKRCLNTKIALEEISKLIKIFNS
jgi:hypothetical protein